MTNYDLGLLQNATGIGKLVGVANTYSDGYLVGGFLLALWFIGILALRKFGFGESVTVCSWICFILSLPLAYAGWLNLYFTLFYLIMGALGLFYLYASNSQGG